MKRTKLIGDVLCTRVHGNVWSWNTARWRWRWVACVRLGHNLQGSLLHGGNWNPVAFAMLCSMREAVAYARGYDNGTRDGLQTDMPAPTPKRKRAARPKGGGG